MEAIQQNFVQNNSKFIATKFQEKWWKPTKASENKMGRHGGGSTYGKP